MACNVGRGLACVVSETLWTASTHTPNRDIRLDWNELARVVAAIQVVLWARSYPEGNNRAERRPHPLDEACLKDPRFQPILAGNSHIQARKPTANPDSSIF